MAKRIVVNAEPRREAEDVFDMSRIASDYNPSQDPNILQESFKALPHYDLLIAAHRSLESGDFIAGFRQISELYISTVGAAVNQQFLPIIQARTIEDLEKNRDIVSKFIEQIGYVGGGNEVAITETLVSSEARKAMKGLGMSDEEIDSSIHRVEELTEKAAEEEEEKVQELIKKKGESEDMSRQQNRLKKRTESKEPNRNLRIDSSRPQVKESVPKTRANASNNSSAKMKQKREEREQKKSGLYYDALADMLNIGEAIDALQTNLIELISLETDPERISDLLPLVSFGEQAQERFVATLNQSPDLASFIEENIGQEDEEYDESDDDADDAENEDDDDDEDME